MHASSARVVGHARVTVLLSDADTFLLASTGDVCTIRCFNSAQAGPFGGCFAVQQTDVTPNKNSPANIATIQQLDAVMAQVLQNQKDLDTSIKANQQAATADDTGVEAVNLLLNIDSKSQAKAPPAAEAAAGLDNGAGNGGNGNKNNGISTSCLSRSSNRSHRPV